MSPFRPRVVKDLLQEVPEAPEWLVHGLLPRGALALLVAYPKVGESTLAGQWVVAVAQGRPFLGRPTHRGAVLIIVAEERKEDVLRRLRHFGMEDDDPIYLWSEGVEDTSPDRTKLAEFIVREGIVLVIVDTLASYLLLKEEIDNSEITRKMLPYVNIARATKTVVLFIHHERKNRDDGVHDSRAIRGGGAILGLADIAFQLHPPPSGGTKRRLKIVGRYQEVPRLLELEYTDDGYVSLGTPEEHAQAKSREQVRAALPMEGQGMTAKEVAAKTGLGEKVARTVLESGYADGSFARTGGGRKGDPYRYARVSECSAAAPELVLDIGDLELREIAEL